MFTGGSLDFNLSEFTKLYFFFNVISTCLANWAISSLKDSAEVMSPDVLSRGEFEASSHLWKICCSSGKMGWLKNNFGAVKRES